MGRPTKYKPDDNDKIIMIMKNGASKVEVAATLGINRDTLYSWCKIYPEFSDTIKKGEDLSQAWWERQARENIGNRQFNTALWYINMKNRFAWKDKQEIMVDNSERQRTEDKIKAFLDDTNEGAFDIS